jgi:hypothetical protein
MLCIGSSWLCASKPLLSTQVAYGACVGVVSFEGCLGGLVFDLTVRHPPSSSSPGSLHASEQYLAL